MDLRAGYAAAGIGVSCAPAIDWQKPQISLHDFSHYIGARKREELVLYMPWSLWKSGPLRMGRAFAEKSPLPLVCLVATAGNEKVACVEHHKRK